MVEYSENSSEKYATNAAVQLQLNKNAMLDYYQLQNEHITATHHSTIEVWQKESSQLTLFFSDNGSQSSRTDVSINLQEAYAACEVHGLYYLQQDEQCIENAIEVKHLAPHSKSLMFYKGILDKKSRALFHGKVYVHNGADHIQAHQANHNLLLSTQAEVKTEPQLEIYADDVKCTHGATVGQLDSDSLFYLQSRGISKQDALKFLTHAFATEILNKITHSFIKNHIQQRVSLYEGL